MNGAVRRLKPIRGLPGKNKDRKMATKTKRATARIVEKPMASLPRSLRTTRGQARLSLKPMEAVPVSRKSRAAGDRIHETEVGIAGRSKSNGHAIVPLSPNDAVRDHAAEHRNETDVRFGGKNKEGGGDGPHVADHGLASACLDLQSLQRHRSDVIKSRIVIDNQLGAMTAQAVGYRSGEEKADRDAKWKLAKEIVSAIRTIAKVSGKNGTATKADKVRMAKAEAVIGENRTTAESVTGIVLAFEGGYAQLDRMQDSYESEMVRLAAELPAANWAENVRGFGLLRLAVVIGETGDLSLYANPGKVWKRLGLAPHNGKMPSTWRSGKEGKLSAEEWTAIGYSPRRRSIMYVIGELLVKLNFKKPDSDEKFNDTDGEVVASGENTPGEEGAFRSETDPSIAASPGKLNPGPYRQRYDEARAKVQPRVDSKEWSKGRAHSHAMLLCAKRLVRDLWIEWRKAGASGHE